jgi:hypothetical protein
MYNVDPDGAGTGAGRVTFTQFANGRFTTGANAPTTASYSTTAGTMTFQTTDPAYIANWN